MDIENIICSVFGVETADMDGRYDMSRHITDCKHFIWYFLHYEEGISISMIAKTYHRSQRQVKYAVAKIKYGIRTQAYYSRIYDRIKEMQAGK